MQAIQMDSSGWPVPDALSSSHHARHAFSRRTFIGGTAAAAGASLGSGLLWPAAGSAASLSGRGRLPRPTTATTTVGGVDFHFTSFGSGTDPSSITDFKGLVGVADVRGHGTARHRDGRTEKLLFDTDMRFMKGTYVGRDGNVHRGTFGFI